MKNEFGDFLEKMNGVGCFLSAGNGAEINTMTISWGFIGAFCNKEILIVPVRKSRYTKEFIDKFGCFSVSIPNGFEKELAFCGSHSGRTCDKFKEAGLKIEECKSIDSIVVGGCEKYYECKVLFKNPIDLNYLPDDIRNKFYGNFDEHILYFGEIVSKY